MLLSLLLSLPLSLSVPLSLAISLMLGGHARSELRRPWLAGSYYYYQ